MKRPRLKKWAKWTCTLAAGAAVVLAVGSRFYAWELRKTSTKQQRMGGLILSQGLVCIYLFDGPIPTSVTPGKYSKVRPFRGWYWGLEGEVGNRGPLGSWRAGLLSFEDSRGWALGTSLMYPVALTLLPTALLWYADRRRLRPGSCGGCGYDRAGLLPTALCPECGGVPTSA